MYLYPIKFQKCLKKIYVEDYVSLVLAEHHIYYVFSEFFHCLSFKMLDVLLYKFWRIEPFWNDYLAKMLDIIFNF